MDVYLWQQFSSNHSGQFYVVGAFASAEQAQHAAEELAHLLGEIKHWGAATNKVLAHDGPLSGPEERYRTRTGIRWNSYSPSLYASDAFSKGIAEAITVWGQLLLIHPEETWQWPTSYYAFIEHWGGKAAIDWVINDPGPVVVVTLICTAPDQDTATALYATLQAALAHLYPEDDLYDAFGDEVPWGDGSFDDNHELGIAGYLQQEGATLRLNLRFCRIERGLPALVGYLEEQGCRNIQYDIGEWDNSASGAL